jgi:hypothetical protein
MAINRAIQALMIFFLNNPNSSIGKKIEAYQVLAFSFEKLSTTGVCTQHVHIV